MSQNLTVNGTVYAFPVTLETNWGTVVTNWASAVSQHTLQKSGGTFTLTADAYFGATYGLQSQYFKSASASLATAGVLRLANTDSIGFRNAADSANLLFGVDSSNNLTFNGVVISGSSALTASRALVSSGAGVVSVATTTATEIGYVNGVTSAIQTQIDAKSPIASPTFTGTVTTPALNISGQTATTVPYLDASKNLISSAVTPTELGYVSGVTSAIQTQLNAKAPIASPTFTGNASFPALVRLVETGGGTDAVSFTGPASTTGYTITMPGSAPTANTALAYDGANYVWSSAGGWTTYANENISGSGSVTTSTTVGQQVRRVTGNGAAVTASSTPFGAVGGWSDGLVIRLIGQSSTNTVTLVHNDAANGAILNGDCTLGAYDVIELQWDSTASRWIEIARSIK